MTDVSPAEAMSTQMSGVPIRGKALTAGIGTPAEAKRASGKRKPTKTDLAPQDKASASSISPSVKTRQTGADGLEGLVSVIARAIEVFGTRDKAIVWLRTPLPALSHKTPLSVLDTASGAEQVEDVLGRIEQGVWLRMLVCRIGSSRYPANDGTGAAQFGGRCGTTKGPPDLRSGESCAVRTGDRDGNRQLANDYIAVPIELPDDLSCRVMSM